MDIVNTILAAISATFHAQRERWILWSPAILGAGIAFYFSLSSEPPFFAGLLAFVFIGAFYWPASQKKPLLFLWLVVVLFALGFTAAQVRTWTVKAPVLERETYPLTVEGRVVAVDALPKAYRITVDDLTITAKWPPEVKPERVRIKLKTNDPAVPQAGDIIRVKTVLLPLSAPVLPGAFDFQRHAFFHRLGATGYAIGNVETVTPREGGFFFEELRRVIRTRIAAGIEDKDTAAIVTAFLIGESKAIPEKTWDVIRQSGIAHLLAISGFHITVICGFLFFGIRALLALSPVLALKYPIKKISAFLSIWGAVFYMLLIGSPVPAERAVLSVSVVMLAIMLDRDPFTLRLAAFAAMVVLLLQPESLMGPSFQMSFAAVVALIAFYESTRDWWGSAREDRSFARLYSLYVLGCFLTTVVATLATAPYSLFHFSRVPLFAGLLTNMIAVPVTSFITLPSGILACLLMPFGWENAPLFVAGKSIELVMATARETASWPHAVYHADSWPSWILCALTLGGLWLCIWRGRVRWLGLLPIVFGLAMMPQTERPDVLVSGDAKLFAVRDESGVLWMSSSTAEKFVRGEWEEQEGGEGVRYWKDAKENLLTCDIYACIAQVKGRKISFIAKPEAFAEECAASDIVFSAEKMPPEACAGKKAQVFDKYKIRDGGAHTVYIDGENIFIRTVTQERGKRPWTGGEEKYVRKYKRGS